jgi:hypothetical protein
MVPVHVYVPNDVKSSFKIVETSVPASASVVGVYCTVVTEEGSVVV